MSDRSDIEGLLLATLDAVSRFRVGQRDSVAAALEAGQLLLEAKDRVGHGGFGNWLDRVGLNARTARRWMAIAERGLTVEGVIAAGGINAAARGAKTDSESDLPNPEPARELAAVESAIADAKARYYRTLTRRQELLRELAHVGDNTPDDCA